MIWPVCLLPSITLGFKKTVCSHNFFFFRNAHCGVALAAVCCACPGVQECSHPQSLVMKSWSLSVVPPAGLPWNGVMRALSNSERRGRGTCHIKQRQTGQRSLSIFYRPDLYRHHLCILLCAQGVISRGIHGVGIYSKYVFLRLFLLLFPWIDISITCKSKKTCLKGGCGVHWNRWSGWQA